MVFPETISELDDVSRGGSAFQKLKKLGMGLQEISVVDNDEDIVCIDGQDEQQTDKYFEKHGAKFNYKYRILYMWSEVMEIIIVNNIIL